MTPAFQIQRGVHTLRQGGIIAYPTEGVWGLGCDPDNPDAVLALLALKQRPIEKGLILVAANIEQFTRLLTHLNQQQFSTLQKSWPGPHTWLIPATERVPPWISGGQPTLALRVSSHPTVAALCKQFGAPIVSTSANLSGKKPATTLLNVQLQFSARTNERVTVVPGSLGDQDKPTTIRDLVTGKIVRS